MWTIITLTLAWMLYASIDGFVQAHYYALYPSEKKHRNLHIFFVIQRAILFLVMCYEIFMVAGAANAMIFGVSIAFMFSFFHNGFYYMARHKLNPDIYKKGFRDDSETSTAIIEIGFGFRTSMMLLGILFIIGVILSL